MIIVVSDTIMLFGDRLRNERKKNNLTAEELANLCDVSRSYITLIENNTRSPGKNLLPKLSRALNLDPTVVINWYLEDVRKKLE